MNLDEAREAFLAFFDKHNHTRVERAPVVARWRNDIYLSIASIAVFQQVKYFVKNRKKSGQPHRRTMLFHM